jgi:hypothetical protein
MLHQHQQTATPPPPFSTPPAEARQQTAADAATPGSSKTLTPERRSAADAMRLYMSLSNLLTQAVADRDRHAYRRTLRAFKLAARRLERRYNAITPTPRLKLGNIHRAPKMPAPQLRDAA